MVVEGAVVVVEGMVEARGVGVTVSSLPSPTETAECVLECECETDPVVERDKECVCVCEYPLFDGDGEGEWIEHVVYLLESGVNPIPSSNPLGKSLLYPLAG